MSLEIWNEISVWVATIAAILTFISLLLVWFYRNKATRIPNNAFSWIAIGIAFLTAISAVGTQYTSTLIDNVKQIAMTNLKNQLSSSTAQVAWVQDQLVYSYDARLDGAGIYDDGNSNIISPGTYGEIYNLLQSIAVHPAHQDSGANYHMMSDFIPTTFPNSTSSIAVFGEIIANDPKYPFAYYYRGAMEKAMGIQGWGNDINMAEKILEITTSIPGHDSSQDTILSNIQKGIFD